MYRRITSYATKFKGKTSRFTYILEEIATSPPLAAPRNDILF
jgi:hypothetical protein